METRALGSLRVSVVGLGCNNFGRRVDAAGTAHVVDEALATGINFFDTADIYGDTRSEELLGSALGARRSAVVLATKFGMKVAGDERRRGARPEYVRRALEDSLRRLRTDYVDLYQLHEPDPQTPISDTLGALDALVREGKVREIGCSNFSAAQIVEAHEAAGYGAARFVSVQNEYSLLHRDPEVEVLAECSRLGLAFIPYFPLASGALTGKYARGRPAPEGSRLSSGGQRDRFLNPANEEAIERLRSFAESRDHSLLELAFAWLLAHPPVASVIAGATRREQVAANAAAASWRLSKEELDEVDRVAPQPRVESRV
ncbi:MAG TPA: aldo/keto reductase [Thermoanaerobaculia bacterium]|nr:aldo/keto reductase [Thermoanaerobaculia bacterium]